MNKIIKLEQRVFFDLSGCAVPHLCFWRVFYSSGSQKTIREFAPHFLPKTVLKFYESALQCHYNYSYITQMTESGIERAFVYRIKK